MTPLEHKYWLLISAAYPPEYVEARGDELISTLLDTADPDQKRPRFAEAFDLIRCGIAERARVHGESARSRARTAVAGVSAFMLALITTATVAAQAMLGTSQAVSVGFSLWLVPATVVALFALRPDSLTTVRPFLAAGAVAAAALGPEAILITRLLLLAVIWLGLAVALTQSTTSRRHRWVVVLSGCLAGTSLGVWAGVRASGLGILRPIGTDWMAPLRFQLPDLFYWIWPALLVGCALVVWLRPATGIVLAAMAVPVLLITQSSSDGLMRTGSTLSNLGFVLAMVTGATLFMTVALVQTMRRT